jgi:hypothetical protein
MRDGDIGYIADNSIWFTDGPDLARGTGAAIVLHQRISAPISKSSLYEHAMKAQTVVKFPERATCDCKVLL